MAKENISSVKANSFFRLPFKPGTRVLTIDILNSYSDFRRPTRPYLFIETRQISFINEILMVGVILGNEEEEKVYFRVTNKELLVSCSVDTVAGYLSRYAYFTLYYLMLYHNEFDFEGFYWPRFFDPNTGKCKYLITYKSRGSLVVASKVRYTGLYKPGNLLPNISKDSLAIKETLPKVQEAVPKNGNAVVGFCLADTHLERWQSNHYPFLVPYIGVLDKKKIFVKAFKSYVLGEQMLSQIEASEEQQRLIDICFSMKSIALILHEGKKDDVKLIAKVQKKNKDNFIRLFELWQEALPILSGRLYTHYHFTFGMRNVKGKPPKSNLRPSVFSNEIPELCFIWKEIGDYYKLELRVRLENQIHEITCFYNTTFFVNLSSVYPRRFFLLNSLVDNELVSFFQKSHFQLLILKIHYDDYCKDFVDQLRTKYQFIKR